MSKITVYQKPTCTTCRQVHQALVESGADFNSDIGQAGPKAQRDLMNRVMKIQSNRRKSI